MKIKEVSPFSTVGEVQVDVRDILKLMYVGKVFNARDVKNVLQQYLLDHKINQVITGADALNLLDSMCYFAYTAWNSAYDDVAEDPEKPGYVLREVAIPEDIVKIARTNGPLKGRGGYRLITRAAFETGKEYPTTDGWEIVEEYVTAAVPQTPSLTTGSPSIEAPLSTIPGIVPPSQGEIDTSAVV